MGIIDTAKEEGRVEGRVEGREEKAIEIAKKLIKKGMTVAEITDATELSPEAIKELIRGS